MMEDKDKILDDIFSNDPLGLLNVKPKTSNVKSADERLSNSFEEINDFISKNEREPAPNPSNISEYQLYSRLKNLREDEDKMLALETRDVYGLLKVEKKEMSSDEFKTEFLCQIIRSGDLSVVPEFTSEIQKEIIVEWPRPIFYDTSFYWEIETLNLSNYSYFIIKNS